MGFGLVFIKFFIYFFISLVVCLFSAIELNNLTFYSLIVLGYGLFFGLIGKMSINNSVKDQIFYIMAAHVVVSFAVCLIFFL